MNRFQLALTQFGNNPSHTDLDLITVLTLLSQLYDGGKIGYVVPADCSLCSEIVAQLKTVNEHWSQKVAQRLIGRAWERRICDFGVPIG